jgi:DNA-binding NtrC family response regulator
VTASTAPILVVDDNALFLRSLIRMLSLKTSVVSATGATEALEVLRQTPCRAVITDLEMPPGMDGFWLLGQVRELFPEVRRVVMSGSPSLSRQIARSGDLVHASLPKPFDYEQLLAILDT